MNFYVWNHENKGKVLIRTLQAAGWQFTGQMGKAHAMFSDNDIRSRAKALQDMYQRGKKIFLYPHAARPTIFNDFPGPQYASCKYVHADFVTAEGHIEIMRRAGVDHPFEIIGWYLCPMRPFIPCESYRKVLFAPIHPNADGSLSKYDKQINADTFKKLLELIGKNEIDLTVRYIGTLPQNGLWKADDVIYTLGDKDQSYKEIDEADLVVSHQTFAYIAIARGVPTVMMGESIPPRIGCEADQSFAWARSWEQYKDLLMYPFDILAEEDTIALFKDAIASDEEIRDWKTRLIGDEFNPERFVELVKKYL